MPTKTLQFVSLSSVGYGERVALYMGNDPTSLPVNPRQRVGTLGIRTHSSQAERLFHKTLAISAIEAATGTSKTLYLNKNSTIRWLNAQLSSDTQLTASDTDEKVLETLQKIHTIGIKTFSSMRINASKLDSLATRIVSVFCRILRHICSSSWVLSLLLLKLLSSSEAFLQRCSESMACSSFKKAIQNVDSYKHFVKSQGSSPRYYSQIPVTSKDSYIKAYSNSKEFGELSLYANRTIPSGSKKDTSTGTSGKPTSWYRGPQEIAAINRSIRISTRAIFGDKPYYLINGFALGPWATGVSIANAAAQDPRGTVCNIGIDTNEIYQAIKDATKVVPPGQPIIVAGYPPHLKEVVDLAQKEGFPLEKYNIIGLVGGESMSENQRELIVQNTKTGRSGFSKCFSAYGASDLDVAIGYETDFAVELRQKLHANPLLAKELVGENDFIPMIFPYDPLNYHIETDADQNLLYTCVGHDRISPRVRYNLGDRGKTMPMSDVLAILEKHGVKLKNMPRIYLPLLFVWGRVGSHVSLEGLKIAPENLEDGLRDQKIVSQVLHHGFLEYEHNGVKGIKILIEVQDAKTVDILDLKNKVITGLRKKNQEFNKLMSTGRPEPELVVYSKGTSPMSMQRQKYPHRKIQYIFKESDVFDTASKKTIETHSQPDQ